MTEGGTIPLQTPPPNYNEAIFDKEPNPPSYSAVVTSQPSIDAGTNIPERTVPQTQTYEEQENCCLSCLVCLFARPINAICDCISQCWNCCCDDGDCGNSNYRRRQYSTRNNSDVNDDQYYNDTGSGGDFCWLCVDTGDNGGQDGDFWGGGGGDDGRQDGDCWGGGGGDDGSRGGDWDDGSRGGGGGGDNSGGDTCGGDGGGDSGGGGYDGGDCGGDTGGGDCGGGSDD